MAPTNTQFSIALHILAALGVSDDYALTSTKLAGSVNTTPSFIRRIVAKLSKAGIVRTTSGKSGFCALVKSPDRISLLEVYRAVDAPGAFAIHDYAATSCLVSRGIKTSLSNTLDKAHRALERSLKEATVAEVIKGLSP